MTVKKIWCIGACIPSPHKSVNVYDKAWRALKISSKRASTLQGDFDLVRFYHVRKESGIFTSNESENKSEKGQRTISNQGNSVQIF